MTVEPDAPETTPLTEDEVEHLIANRCSHCGGTHARACPRVKRMSYHPNGNLAEVEFWPTGKWSEDHVWFPDEPQADSGPSS